MNYQLIMLPNPILVSDKGSKKGEWTIFPNTINRNIKNFEA